MEDILVSSRISRAKKEAGVGVLKELGVTTSDLINSAFDFVIETHQLPGTAPKAQTRKQRSSELASFITESTLAVDWGGDMRSYKDILRERRVSDYESLA